MVTSSTEIAQLKSQTVIFEYEDKAIKTIEYFSDSSYKHWLQKIHRVLLVHRTFSASCKYPGFEVFLIFPAGRICEFCFVFGGQTSCLELWNCLGCEILMLKFSQFLTSALETVRDYLWNFFGARTYVFSRTFCSGHAHRFGKLRYFASDFHIKAHLRAHSAPQRAYSRNSNIFGISA